MDNLFTDERGARPSTGWLLNVKLPTASGGFTNEHVEGNLLLLANKTFFRERVELEVNAGPGVAWDGSTFGQGLYAVTLSYFVPVERKRLRLFTEVFGVVPAERDGGSTASAGAGVQYWINRRFAFDTGFQLGLSRLTKESARSSFYVGFGVLF